MAPKTPVRRSLCTVRVPSPQKFCALLILTPSAQVCPLDINPLATLATKDPRTLYPAITLGSSQRSSFFKVMGTIARFAF